MPLPGDFTGFGINVPTCYNGQVFNGAACVDPVNATLDVSMLPVGAVQILPAQVQTVDLISQAKTFATANPILVYGGLALAAYLLFIKK